jgi:hypothetical protein
VQAKFDCTPIFNLPEFNKCVVKANSSGTFTFHLIQTFPFKPIFIRENSNLLMRKFPANSISRRITKFLISFRSTHYYHSCHCPDTFKKEKKTCPLLLLHFKTNFYQNDLSAAFRTVQVRSKNVKIFSTV